MVWQARHSLMYDTPYMGQREWSGSLGGVPSGSATVSFTEESGDTAVLLPRYHARVTCRQELDSASTHQLPLCSRSSTGMFRLLEAGCG